MVDTHCLPSGSLGTNELGVNNIPSTVTVSDPGSGNRRGIIVWIHGLSDVFTPSPMAVPNTGGVFSYLRVGDFESSVVSDGWIFVYVACPEDFITFTGFGISAIYNQVSSLGGTSYLNTTLHWWDHITNYLAVTYGANRPIIVAGFSMGGVKALRIVAGQTSGNVVGYIAHCPGTLLETANPLLTPPNDFYDISWSGFDLNTTFMDAVSIPGTIGYGTADLTIGWAATTVAAGSNGVTVSTFAGSGTLDIASSTNMVVGAAVQVTGLTGGTGSAIIQFTGTGSGTLTGCTTVEGSGTLATGNPCTQQYTDQIITNAIAASQPVTRHSATGEDHEFTGTPSGSPNDAATYAAWIVSTLDPSYPVSF